MSNNDSNDDDNDGSDDSPMNDLIASLLESFQPTIGPDGEAECQCPDCVAGRAGEKAPRFGSRGNPILVGQDGFNQSPLGIQLAVSKSVVGDSVGSLKKFFDAGGKLVPVLPSADWDPDAASIDKLSDLIGFCLAMQSEYPMLTKIEDGFDVKTVAVETFTGTREEAMARLKEKSIELGTDPNLSVGVQISPDRSPGTSPTLVPRGTQRAVEKIFSSGSRKKPVVE